MEIDIDVFRHKLLRSQVVEQPRNTVHDGHKFAGARLLDNKVIVRLTRGTEAKKSISKESKQGTNATSALPSLDNSEWAEWDEDAEDEEKDAEIVVSESGSGGDSDLEDVIVVGGESWLILRFFWFAHELWHFFWFDEYSSLLYHSEASVYGSLIVLTLPGCCWFGYGRPVLSTGPGNVPAVRVWNRKTVCLGSRQVEIPDPLFHHSQDGDPYLSTHGLSQV